MLAETYRPKIWDEVIAQDKAVSILKAFENRGKLSGRAYWIAGKSGTGKTTIARIIANKVASGYCITEMDAQRVMPSNIQEWTLDQHYVPMGSNGRCYIINEAHGLRKDTIRALLTFLETLAQFTTVIFTTTSEAQENFFDEAIDSDPLLSRCILVPITSQRLAKPFAEKARFIAQKEGLDGQPIEAYLRLVNKHKSNFRGVLQSIESGVMLKGI